MKRLIKEFTAGNAMLSVLAVVASFIVGGILIAVSSEDVQTTLGYITARPSDFFNALWNAVFGAYDAMFRGAIFNYKATSFVQMIKPITETLAYATPITMAGLGLAVAFRSGLFNIGATGRPFWPVCTCISTPSPAATGTRASIVWSSLPEPFDSIKASPPPVSSA